MCHQQTAIPDIMHYESDIWAIADILIAAGIKQSDFPDYMMPFFALVMVEGRMQNVIREINETEHLTRENGNDFLQAFRDRKCGYNEYIVERGMSLRSICQNDIAYEHDFENYLRAFDSDTKRLLGVDCPKGEPKYMNIDTYADNLKGKGVLFQVLSSWARIDLSPYNNSQITDLEQHIKRKWADLSADTAGEQYTPEDIIALIADIVIARYHKPERGFVHVYDPACGGANLLYGMEAKLTEHNNRVSTYGSEYNDKLFALSAIESGFHDRSTISYGNTLTNVPFKDKQMNIVVANPPYGTPWKSFLDDIKKDQTGQFHALPATSDGQMLFMQHTLHSLAETGIAVEVHNGSSLFTGDAGSGESEIRRHIIGNDWVDAIIQMPKDEFFNTGITTYLWIFDKAKPDSHKGKILLIDASGLWTPLRKSRGQKRCEMTAEQRERIVETLVEYKDSDISKLYDRDHFYYNKQGLTLYTTSRAGQTVHNTICADNKTYNAGRITNLTIGGTETALPDATDAQAVKEMNRILEQEQQQIVVTTEGGKSYESTANADTIVEHDQEARHDLGCGLFVLKAAGKRTDKHLQLTIEPRTSRDSEITPYSSNPEGNTRLIDEHLNKYVTRPYSKEICKVGVEVNFNKEFYVPAEVESVESILQRITTIDSELKEIERRMKL